LQLVAFGFAPNKEEGFTLFFETLKKLVEKEIDSRIDKTIKTSFGEIFVCDRCIAQRNSLLKVFNGAHIIHCREHIKRNVLMNVKNIIIFICMIYVTIYFSKEHWKLKQITLIILIPCTNQIKNRSFLNY